MSEPFKQSEVRDLFTPERTGTFTRPHERDDVVVVATDGKPLHLSTGTLQIVAKLLAEPKVQGSKSKV